MKTLAIIPARGGRKIPRKIYNIFTQVHYIPVHLQPYYKQFGWEKGDFPVAEAYYEKCLSLPMYPTLTADEQNYVIENVLRFFNDKII